MKAQAVKHSAITALQMVRDLPAILLNIAYLLIIWLASRLSIVLSRKEKKRIEKEAADRAEIVIGAFAKIRTRLSLLIWGFAAIRVILHYITTAKQ